MHTISIIICFVVVVTLTAVMGGVDMSIPGDVLRFICVIVVSLSLGFCVGAERNK